MTSRCRWRLGSHTPAHGRSSRGEQPRELLQLGCAFHWFGADERGHGDRLRSERRERCAQTTGEVAAAVPVEGAGPVGQQLPQPRHPARADRVRRVQSPCHLVDQRLGRGDVGPVHRHAPGPRRAGVVVASRTARRSVRATAWRSATAVSRAACAASALPAGAGTPTASARSNRAARSRAVTHARMDGRV